MTHEQAKRILDETREGVNHKRRAVYLALRITGDIGGHERRGSSGVDCEISPEDWRGRVRQRAIMVGASYQ